MRKYSRFAFLSAAFFFAVAAKPAPEIARWKAEAARITITRDDWGIAHIHGASDADAVFGMIYTEAEDDFARIEANYLTALGRTAEADGEAAIWQDMRARLYVSEAELKADYTRTPLALQALMNAWADGLNYYLATHPKVHPQVLKRFEPWMALSFTEGSIGGDIEKIKLDALQSFYSGKAVAEEAPEDPERQASNGIAIAPSLTQNGHALLLINPHTSHYFRSEQQVSSDQGLNAYGAATWGQFFIYQGFNEHAGWMHTSTGADNVDEFAETIEGQGKARCYRYGENCRPLGIRPITVKYRTKGGQIASKTITSYFTHHGPIVRADGNRWIAVAMMNRPVEALEQSFYRTKARDFDSFIRVAQLRANSSNDTIFADDKGEIAYLHPQFMPRRDDRFDYTRPVDGSDPATDWASLHRLAELPNVFSPPNGWVQNTNAWPYKAAGAFSPELKNFPKYMDQSGENWRGIHAQQLLANSRNWTLERLNRMAYDNYQPGFADYVPRLIQAYDHLSKTDPRRAQMVAPVAVLRTWDDRWNASSVAQTLATYWGEALIKALNPPPDEDKNRYMDRLGRDTTPAQQLKSLADAVATLTRDFGRWQVPWGEVNRFQRISDSIVPQFSDEAPSIPVPFASAKYGSLASIEQRVPKTTRHIYGNYGNSFVAVVEFGPRVRAEAISAGGESGDPTSPHFSDQSGRFAAGALREVYFYPDQLKGHTERVYHPGE